MTTETTVDVVERERMGEVDPGAQKQALETLQKAPGSSRQSRRDFKAFFRVVTTWTKKRQLRNSAGWLQCNKGEFKMHWLGRGKKKRKVKKMWARATTVSKINKGLAFWKERGLNKKGKPRKKRLIAWVKKQGEFNDDEIVEVGHENEGEEQFMDEDSFAALQRRAAPSLPSTQRASLVAGINIEVKHSTLKNT